MSIDIKKIDNFYKSATLSFKKKPTEMTALEFALIYQINQKYHSKDLIQSAVSPDDVINEETLLIMMEYINLVPVKMNKNIAENILNKNKELVSLLAKNKEDSLTIALQKTNNIYDLVNKLALFKKNGLFKVAYDFSSEKFSVIPTELTKSLI
ncbi:hypothetical protein [Lactobacillus intestinalis]|uniref:Uncharacterized protein n=1 Tax=Lactobacillus intestinalis TaxID=151781 RepID=A0A4V3REH8_9LACO|nr:hypothetical protein [Lactobacillus intestinalis]KAI4315680.1 hypothetical protein C821_000075 [Lactobacillus intestinalis]TGY16610.1 hypothetical protein E5351_03370 [Lactobacillus intestinalis]